jgi:hypothetical protein
MRWSASVTGGAFVAAAGRLAVVPSALPSALSVVETSVATGAFGEARLAAAALSTEPSSELGFRAGKGGGLGIVAGDGVSISVRWMVAASGGCGGAGGARTAAEIG